MPKKPIDAKRGHRHAPAPQRGMILALYQAIDAGEIVNEDEIIELLPATDAAPQAFDKAKVHHGLLNGKSYGYFVHEPKSDTWRIAPRDYYDARQKYLNDPRRHRTARPRKAKQGRREVVRIVHDWKYSLAFGALTFLIGIAVGMQL